jgi:hypothetical protein
LVRRRERRLRTNASGSTFDIAPFNTAATSQTKENWLDTLRGRIGLAWDRALFYGASGAAFARPVGWVVGAIAYTAWDHVTLKLEYLQHSERQWRD